MCTDNITEHRFYFNPYLFCILSYLSGIKNTTITKTLTRRRGARNHGDGWVPTGAAAKWVAARIDRMHWISAGVGGDRGTRGKDGFPQELQQMSGSQERQDALDKSGHDWLGPRGLPLWATEDNWFNNVECSDCIAVSVGWRLSQMEHSQWPMSWYIFILYRTIFS